jgi:plastocyanin
LKQEIKEKQMRKNLNRKTTTVLIGATLCALVGLGVMHIAHAAEPTAADAPANEVRIDNFTFNAQSLTVAAGSEVTWINRDDIPHTVVSVDLLFKSKALDTDDKFTYKFTKPGTYKYFCSIHPKMTAEIVVK